MNSIDLSMPSIDTNYRPRLIIPDALGPIDFALEVLELQHGQKGRPCHSVPELNAAYWATAVNKIGERGVLLETSRSGLSNQTHWPSYYFGTTFSKRLSLRYEASNIATYTAPSAETAVVALAKFLKLL